VKEYKLHTFENKVLEEDLDLRGMKWAI